MNQQSAPTQPHDTLRDLWISHRSAWLDGCLVPDALARLLAVALQQARIALIRRTLPLLLGRVPAVVRTRACLLCAEQLEQADQPGLALQLFQSIPVGELEWRDHLRMGLLAQSLDRSSEALLSFALAYQSIGSGGRDRAQIAHHLGQLSRSLGRMDQAVVWFLLSISDEPLHWAAHMALQYTQCPHELLSRVEACYAAISESYPDQALLLQLHARYLVRLNRISDAIKANQSSFLADTSICSDAAGSGVPRAPDVLIIGVQKCGTSSLARWLGGHSRLWMHPRKELHYFDLEVSYGPEWYYSSFPAFPVGSGVLRGEATPNYFQLADVPPLVAAQAPSARMIVLLRDPLDRAMSWLSHLRRHHGFEGSAETVLAAELADLRAGLIRGQRFGAYRPPNALLGSCYDWAWRRWLESFSADRFLLLRSEDLFRSPLRGLQVVHEFLGVEYEHPMEPLAAENVSPAPAPAISADLAAEIREFLAEHTAEAFAAVTEIATPGA